MSRSSIPTLLAVALLVAGSVSSQTIIRVPTDYPNIGAAIAQAANGDTVEVSPGIYPGGIDFLGKSITVVSTSGAEVTFISGGVAGNVLFHSGEGAATTLEGFTIANGMADANATLLPFSFGGGGIVLIGASPVIRHCVIRANVGRNGSLALYGTSAGQSGGGVLIHGGSPQFTDCVFEDNAAGDGESSFGQPAGNGGNGGAVAIYGQATALFHQCVFRNNRSGRGGDGFPAGAGGHGGAVFAAGGSSSFNSVNFNDNQAATGGALLGAGVYAPGGVGGDGGAVALQDSAAAYFQFASFLANRAGDSMLGTFDSPAGGSGGAISTRGLSTLGIDSSSIENNFAGAALAISGGGRGGGLCLKGASAYVSRCLIAGNLGGGGGLGGAGGVHFETTGSIEKSMILSNHGGDGEPGGTIIEPHYWSSPGDGGVGGIEVTASVQIVNCLVANNSGGWGGNATATFAGQYGGSGGVGNLSFGSSGGGALKFSTVASGWGGLGGYSDPGAIGGSTSPGANGVGDIKVATNSPLAMTNSILGTLFVQSGVAFTIPTVQFCCVEGGFAGAGNFDLDPRFVDPGMNDFRVAVDSPCIDTGVLGVPGMPFQDLDDHARWIGESIDIGAYEALPPDWPFTGSGDDFTMESFVNGVTAPRYPAKAVVEGDTLTLALSSPGGTHVGDLAFIAVQPWTIGRPEAPTGLPMVLVNPFTGPIVFIFGTPWPAETTPLVLIPGGVSVDLPVPPALSGSTIRFQAFSFSIDTANGWFASSDAHDVTIH